MDYSDECSFVKSFIQNIDNFELSILLNHYFINADDLKDNKINLYKERVKQLKLLKISGVSKCEIKSIGGIIVELIVGNERIPFKLKKNENGEFRFDGFIPMKKGGEKIAFWI